MCQQITIATQNKKVKQSEIKNKIINSENLKFNKQKIKTSFLLICSKKKKKKLKS